MGTSPVVRTVSIDAKNRVWFSSPGYVGLYTDQAAATITIEMVIPVPTDTPALLQTPAQLPAPAPVLPVITQDQPPFFADDSFLKFLNPIIDPVVRAVRAAGLPV